MGRAAALRAARAYIHVTYYSRRAGWRTGMGAMLLSIYPRTSGDNLRRLFIGFAYGVAALSVGVVLLHELIVYSFHEKGWC